MGWGSGPWGSMPWGSGVTSPTEGGPLIQGIDPSEGETGVAQSTHVTVRTTSPAGINLSTLNIAVDGTYYVLGGSATNGASISLTEVSDGWDTQIDLPVLLPLFRQVEVFVTVNDDSAQLGAHAYSFHVGAGARLLQVTNPSPGILLAHFNRPMTVDEVFLFLGNWIVSQVSADSALELTRVVGHTSRPEVAILSYSGGSDGTYQLKVLGVTDLDGNELEAGWDTAEFELAYPEEEPLSIRIFDSIYGPLGIAQRVRRRRTMDDHVANRSIAIGMDAQFRLRLRNMDGSAGRSGRPGRRRT